MCAGHRLSAGPGGIWLPPTSFHLRSFPFSLSASLSPDQFCISVQHRQDPDDKITSIHHIRDDSVQVSDGHLDPAPCPSPPHTQGDGSSPCFWAGPSSSSPGSSLRLPEETPLSVAPAAASPSLPQEGGEGHPRPPAPPGHHLHALLRQPRGGRPVTDRVHLFQLLPAVIPGEAHGLIRAAVSVLTCMLRCLCPHKDSHAGQVHT